MTQNLQPGPGAWTPPNRQPAELRSQRQYTGPHTPAARPYTAGKRLFFGLVWSLWTLVLGIGGLALLASSPGAGMLSLVLAALAGRYAYRIWTWQAKSLWFFIMF